ncbi:MAG: hypothetical protein U0165_07915 [Polyangiaceae bacterium]
MWVRRAAIRSIPAYARVSIETLERVEEGFDEDPESEARLERAFSRFERTQPALANRVANKLHALKEETSLALGYFLTLSVWLSFEQTFGARLTEVAEQDLEAAHQAFQLDEQLRQDDPEESVDTDDVIAMEQPNVVTFIREHIDVALETNPKSVRIEEVDEVYQLVLIELMSLSYAVRPPDRYPQGKHEWSA